jgi:hypothetical protein
MPRVIKNLNLPEVYIINYIDINIIDAMQWRRVADASVMPRIITGPGTAASTHMIAGRAAQLILG